MLYAREPSDEEMQELKRMMQQEVGRVSQRAHMVVLSIHRKSVPQIAQLFETCRATVRFWIKRFNAEGPAGLYDRDRSGRPPKATQELKDAIVQLVQDDPLKEGYLATFWTVAMLVLALVGRVGMKLSPSTVRRVLHHLGLSWGRPRLAMPDKVDPEKASKQWAIVKAVWAAGPGAAVLYADECRIQLLPLIRAMWHWVGQQIRIPTPGNNQSRAIFGMLNIRTGQWDYLIRPHMRKEDFIAFLEHVLVVYPVGPIVLIIDSYSSHTAHVVQAWLVEHPRLQVLYLPKYCSHLNPVELIWRQLKNDIAPNRLHASMNIMLDTVTAFFADLTPARALACTAAG
jgi:transposase